VTRGQAPPVPARVAALGRLASARLSDAAFSTGWAAARALPEPAVRALARGGADAATRRRGPGVRRLEANLARVLAARAGPAARAAGDGTAGLVDPAYLAATTRAAMRSYARYWTEVFRLPATPPDVVLARFDCADEHLLRDALASGRGTILALAHSGNWDHAGAWAALTGMPFTTVAERLEPASLFDRFVAFRESLGMEVLPLGRPGLFTDLADRLRAGGTLCLLADRDLSATGVEVDLFGAPARVPAGPALLALRTGAVLLPVSVWYGWEGGPVTRARIHPAVPVPRPGGSVPRARAMTQAVLDALATGPDGIGDHPEDWHMLQRLWVDDRAPRPRQPAGVPA
jgi:lauroyl/myristoyl acyltransferase